MFFSSRYTEDTEVAQSTQRRFGTVDTLRRCARVFGDGLESRLGVLQIPKSVSCALGKGSGLARSSMRIGLRRAEALQKTA